MDEFENFATDDFADVMEQSRKFALALVLAHQNFSQISTKLKESALGCCCTRISFQVGYSDAQRMASEFFRYTEDEVKRERLLQSGEITYTYRSSGEQRERLAQDIQNLDQRVIYVHEKLARLKLTRLRTLDVAAPATLLGMSVHEAGEYIESLPIGGKYLVERAQIERDRQPTAQGSANTFSSDPSAAPDPEQEFFGDTKAPNFS